MSDIRERLRALKKKKDRSGPADTDSGTERRKKLDDLRAIIADVESRPPDRNRCCLESQVTRGLLTAEFIEGPGQNIEDLIPGEFLDTPHGPCFQVRTVYPWHHYQGKVAVNSLLEMPSNTLAWALSDSRLTGVDFKRAVFFDTETTGLDTGTGTYIFLAGLGYFQDREFIVEQYFMRDFPEEPAVMHALEEILKRFTYVVSYNGKTYDWPLLETRFIINRRTQPMPEPLHIDLLMLVRRLYRHRLPDCRLLSVETGILDFHRKDDVPGALLPDLYFKYIRSRDARFIQRAFAHNAHDIISLAAVSSEILRFLADPFPDDTRPAEDLFGLARLLESSGDIGNALTAYRKALTKGLPAALYGNALTRLSLLHKFSNDYDEAVKLWQIFIQTGGGRTVFPYEELAKYYEHQVKDFRQALHVVHRAFDELVLNGWEGDRIRKDLQHRRRRLEARIKGEKWY
ncbi:ribonuclease H-like domain-containing protein [bacterium]|nr:ribonuclease H-like domain-containing protein [candidate division CSSED10-310 bacterium]